MELAIKLQELTGKDALSYSSMKEAYKDLKRFDLYVRGLLRKETDSLSFGTLYDDVLLTPDCIGDKYAVFDDTEICEKIGGKQPRLTTAYKDAKKHFMYEAGHRSIVSVDDMNAANAMAKRIKDSGVYDTYLSGEHQKKVIGFINEFPVKGFLDNLGDGFISDLKTSSNPDAFKRDVMVYDYDLQVYIYTELTGIKDFYWIVQGTNSPYSIRVIKASEYTIASGKMKFDMAYANILSYVNGEMTPDAYYEFSDL